MIDLLRFIFPPKCIFCGTLLEIHTELEICSECYKKIHFSNTDFSKTIQKSGYGSYYSDVACIFEYSGIVRDAIKRYKFHGKCSYYRTFAALLAKKLKDLDLYSEFDLIISVPLHKSRERTRGYNQSRLISQELSRQTGIRDGSRLLSRVRNTSSQSLIIFKEERYKNIKDAFKVNDINSISGKSIVLVDDILTTGSTVGECSRVLKEAGAKDIVAAVIASGRKY